MNQILNDVRDSRRDALRREIAHEHSARYHGKVGVRLGLISTTLSTIASTSIFAVIIRNFGLDGEGTLVIPQGIGHLFLFYGVIIILIVSPVLSACLTYLNEPGQVAKHKSASADYYLIRERLGMLLGKYENVDFTDEIRESVQKEFKEISTEMAKLRKESIRLTTPALSDAGEEIKSNHP